MGLEGLRIFERTAIPQGDPSSVCRVLPALEGFLGSIVRDVPAFQFKTRFNLPRMDAEVGINSNLIMQFFLFNESAISGMNGVWTHSI